MVAGGYPALFGTLAVIAFGLISLTAGLGALAASLLLCAALAAPRNHASPHHPPAGIT